jgi:hypothetical protein
VGPGEATTNIHASLISPGVLEALHHVPFHGNGVAPLSRRVLAGPSVHPEVKKHIVSHEIRKVSAARRSYCGPYVHDCDEINILLSLTGLSYELRLGDEIYIIAAPATIHIPAGWSTAPISSWAAVFTSPCSTPMTISPPSNRSWQPRPSTRRLARPRRWARER